MIKKLFQTKCLLYSITLVYALTLLCGCDMQSYQSPRGYNLEKPQKSELGKVLNEISGLSYNPGDSSLLAISDSEKKIFEIRLKEGKLRDFTDNIIEGGQDPEDLVFLEDKVYILISKGLIYEVPLTADTIRPIPHDLGLEGTNDFETLYYDEESKALIMLCKKCEGDDNEKRRTAYRFDLAAKAFDSTAFYRIGTGDVKTILKDEDAKFDPSAAAVHPVNKKLYILSSAGNLLVIAERNGKPLEVFRLNPDEHPQAEGIAFAPNGDLYISNEGKYGTPTLQVFRYQQAKKK